jgi:CDGSH-type Zn-finger protein
MGRTVNVIVVTAGGPYYCRGRIELLSPDGTLLESVSEVWLCRCGQSRSKPHCDGNHALANFEDTTFSVATGAPPADPDAVLRIRLRRDGPLKLDGPCEVQAPDGTLLMRGDETALCRCGQSGKRPFCDGTHRSVGFSA